MGELLQPYEFEFFRNGVIVATLAGVLCGLVGVFVVLKGMSYIGHGLSTRSSAASPPAPCSASTSCSAPACGASPRRC